MPSQPRNPISRRRTERGRRTDDRASLEPSGASKKERPPWFLSPEADLVQGLINDYMSFLDLTDVKESDPSQPPPAFSSAWWTQQMFNLVESATVAWPGWEARGWDNIDEQAYQGMKESRDKAIERESAEKGDRPELIHQLLDEIKKKEDKVFSNRAISRIFFNELNAIIKKNSDNGYTAAARAIQDHYKDTAQSKLYNADLAAGHLTP